MKLKQKTITSIITIAVMAVVGGSVSVQPVAANRNWGPGTECGSLADGDPEIETNCTTFQTTCSAGFAEEGVDQARREGCEAAGYSYDDSGALQVGSKEKCEDLKTSILNVDSLCKDKDGPIFGLLKWVLRIMTAGVGVAAVGGIAWGALLYTTAENKPEQTKKAISIITNVVIGIVAYALMAVFLNFLIPGGIIG